MKTIVSRSIPFKDIMNDLSREMQTTYFKSCDEYSLKLPKTYGEGYIKGVNFMGGIGILIYDCMFYEDTEIQFILNEVHPLKFIYCEEGKIIHYFENSDEEHVIGELQSIIVSSCQNRGHILKFKGNVRTKINNLEINRAEFLKSKMCQINSAKPEIKRIFTDTKGLKQFHFAGNYSLKTANIFQEMNEFTGEAFERNLFIHSKVYEILRIQLLEYMDAQNQEENRSVLLNSEVNSIYKASQYIDENIADIGTIQELARRVGLNTNKLQTGFKSIFGTTVNGYIQNKRLMEASVLIKNTDLSFSEIANKVGISSKSYFSKIFKDHYGKTPSEIRTGLNTKDLSD